MSLKITPFNRSFYDFLLVCQCNLVYKCRFGTLWQHSIGIQYITRSCYVCCGDSYVTKYDNFKNSRWQMPSFQKSSFGHNSAADNCPISVKFLWEEAVFDRILVMARRPTYTGVPKKVFLLCSLDFGERRLSLLVSYRLNLVLRWSAVVFYGHLEILHCTDGI